MKSLKNTLDSQNATLAPQAGAFGDLDGSSHNPLGMQNVFTPCVVVSTLLKNFHSAARNASSGYVIVFSSACSSFDQFGKNQGTEELRTRSANALAPTIGGRSTDIYPHMQSVAKMRHTEFVVNQINLRFASGFFEEKTRRKINNPQNIPQPIKTPTSANDQ